MSASIKRHSLEVDRGIWGRGCVHDIGHDLPHERHGRAVKGLGTKPDPLMVLREPRDVYGNKE